jgi:hypothetical protein
MNPDCRVLGSVASSQSAPSDASKNVTLRREEARVLAAKARSLSESITVSAPQTREERMTYARNLRRIVMDNRWNLLRVFLASPRKPASRWVPEVTPTERWRFPPARPDSMAET